MTKYKLNITYTFTSEDPDHEEAKRCSKIILKAIQDSFGDNPDTSLTIEGDRSGANYLAPVNNKHFKHGKVPLSEIKLD